MKEVKVAIVGYGGIARTHNKGYHKLCEEAHPVRVAAYCDVREEQFTKDQAINLGKTTTPLFSDAKLYTSVDKLIEDSDFDMADVCVPDYLHREITEKLLLAGKHVLCEKPMALNYDDCLSMIETAKKAGKRLMVGQCLRFNPAYVYLKEAYASGRYGKIKNLFMNRLSVSPTWGFENFFEKTECCGGSIMNLHIHDVDMARFIFGEPEKVSCISHDGAARWAMVNSRLMYDGFFVVANSSFCEAKGVPFKADYRARFEDAEIIFEGGKVTVYPDNGEKFEAELKGNDGYTEEIRYITDLILDETAVNDKNPPESAARSVRLIELLRESAASDGAYVPTV